VKAVTIRGVDAAIADKLKTGADAQGKSVNQLILDLLRTSLGLDKQKKYSRSYTDLDHLFGRWSEQRYRAVSEAIARHQRIDPEPRS
jgi:hypothetical protein